MRRSEAFGPVYVADHGFHAGGISEGTEEFIRCQVREPNPIHAVAFRQNILACVKSQYRIADPGRFAFDFKSFVSIHGVILRLWDRLREFFRTLSGNSLAQMVFRIGIPITGFEFHEN